MNSSIPLKSNILLPKISTKIHTVYDCKFKIIYIPLVLKRRIIKDRKQLYFPLF